MRVSPIGWAFDTYNKVIAEAKESAIVTHSHQDGVVCAQAVAASIFLARLHAHRPVVYFTRRGQ